LGMDRYLEPGTAVRRINHGDGSWEDGIVVHCWLSDEINAHDCPGGPTSGEALRAAIRFHITDRA